MELKLSKKGTSMELLLPPPDTEAVFEAFRFVFKGEKLFRIDYTSESARVILNLHSTDEEGNEKIRTYAHVPPQSFVELFENTPSLDVK